MMSTDFLSAEELALRATEKKRAELCRRCECITLNVPPQSYMESEHFIITNYDSPLITIRESEVPFFFYKDGKACLMSDRFFNDPDDMEQTARCLRGLAKAERYLDGFASEMPGICS